MRDKSPDFVSKREKKKKKKKKDRFRDHFEINTIRQDSLGMRK